ncbi:S-methyl-5'-thioadenosine phosphorylase [Candidatus Bathyarchaeota archaeon]|nr:S-methyl-5'-thioadenosine phosphorylase [Candidatus Bathyarchaeota archaeon]
MADEYSANLAIIGGTGIYDPELLTDRKEVKLFTPYGMTSDLFTLGNFAGKKIAFLQRHGRGHVIPPHKINFRANIWALKELGVKQIIASSAVGSLREDYKPGEFVLTDQFIDRTKNRFDTFYEGGQICHISSADPICPSLREYFSKYAEENHFPIHKKGTYVCIEGPRFSTRAESKLFRDWDCDIIGMTLYPEVVLAREAEICYVTISMVTDYDVWAEKPVSAVEVLEIMRENSSNFKKLIMGAIPNLPKCDECNCQHALENALA